MAGRFLLSRPTSLPVTRYPESIEDAHGQRGTGNGERERAKPSQSSSITAMYGRFLIFPTRSRPYPTTKSGGISNPTYFTSMGTR